MDGRDLLRENFLVRMIGEIGAEEASDAASKFMGDGGREQISSVSSIFFKFLFFSEIDIKIL